MCQNFNYPSHPLSPHGRLIDKRNQEHFAFLFGLDSSHSFSFRIEFLAPVFFAWEFLAKIQGFFKKKRVLTGKPPSLQLLIYVPHTDVFLPNGTINEWESWVVFYIESCIRNSVKWV